MLKGVLLCGGKGTRLAPMTEYINKHLLPVYSKPMVLYPLDTLKSLGVNDILIVSGGDHIGAFMELLGDGSKFGVTLTYKVQAEANGIAGALALAENFSQGYPVATILGDNIFHNKEIKMSKVDGITAQLFTKWVAHPERFGVVGETLLGFKTIVEKPKMHIGNDAVVGLYIYPNDVFDVIRTLKPSDRGELEVTDISNFYLTQDRVEFHKIEGWWSDAGTHESLLESSIWAASNSKIF